MCVKRSLSAGQIVQFTKAKPTSRCHWEVTRKTCSACPGPCPFLSSETEKKFPYRPLKKNRPRPGLERQQYSRSLENSPLELANSKGDCLIKQLMPCNAITTIADAATWQLLLKIVCKAISSHRPSAPGQWLNPPFACTSIQHRPQSISQLLHCMKQLQRQCSMRCVFLSTLSALKWLLTD